MKRAQMLTELEKVGAGGHALAMQLLGNQDDAADVLQDALVAVLGSQSFDPNRGSFKSWFLAVVRNRCLDLLRQRQRRLQVAIDEIQVAAGSSSNPESAFEQDEIQTILKRELRRLPAEKREILILREYLDLTYAEVGKVLGVLPGTVMSRLHRARLALVKRMRTHESPKSVQLRLGR